jgi:hypothetical protein
MEFWTKALREPSKELDAAIGRLAVIAGVLHDTHDCSCDGTGLRLWVLVLTIART